MLLSSDLQCDTQPLHAPLNLFLDGSRTPSAVPRTQRKKMTFMEQVNKRKVCEKLVIFSLFEFISELTFFIHLHF
jgi:hypothetical protein